MKVKGVDVEIKFQFDVFYSGWECDSKGYVVAKSNGQAALVLSNHGRYYFASEKELAEFIAV